jgi:hypothetical protein
VGNYFIAGPNSTNSFLSMFSATDHVYHRDNYADLNKDGKLNGRLVTDEDFNSETATLLKEPSLLPKSSVKISSSAQAYQTVLAEAGSSLKRDAVDERIVGYLKSKGTRGAIFKTEADAGGQPSVKPVMAKVKDTDLDGIPDSWEKAHQLNPLDAADAQQQQDNGYTALEQYLNGLVK